ncbi:MAG: TIGR04282 family arsenosugar biosynthesis glycosyltransferase [Gammaproteobacteria bacterium]
MRADNTLILFTKAPQICRVKTRMNAVLSHRECLYLHRKLTENAINQFQSNNKFKLVIYTTSIDKVRYSYPRGITVKKQIGKHLGAKMDNAINQETKNGQRTVLIGSDCLMLDINYIFKAFDNLSKSNNIVIGPTIDGGYVLIGMKKQNTFLFNNLPWGASTVLDKTLVTAHKRGRKINTLEKISDLDTVEDLHQLKKLNILPEWASILTN